MSLLSLSEVSIKYADTPLLDRVNLLLDEGERVGLLGRNGAGKTTLLKLIHGDLPPDEGTVSCRQQAQIALLPQEIPFDLTGKVFDVVAGGFNECNHPPSPDQDKVWKNQIQIERVIASMRLNPDAEFQHLSAGMKRRVLLAKGLVRNPDILLLDEPTNHLDIDAIIWLEKYLQRYPGALLFVTHDRMFLRRLATRIVELDRGILVNWTCDYDTFLQRRQEAWEIEQVHWQKFDKKLAQEENWIRQGVKARRTRNEGRVRALLKLRETRRERRIHPGKVRIQVQETERSGELVIEAENVTFAYGGAPIIQDFSTLIMRGDKVGIIGPNGSGKTTLLRILLGELPPQRGHIRHGTRLEVVYFDQLRVQLQEEKSVFENIGEGSDWIAINGQNKHIIGYLQDFLFSPERSRSPVRILSGGERNRLLLAKLFARPTNVLVLDEPTNDLDAETLELLEELLLDYQGTLLMVSHDRTFLNNVVTSTIAFEGDGRLNEYVGGYDDWLRQRAESIPIATQKVQTQAKKQEKTTGRLRLTYKEKLERETQKRELDALPQQIEEWESEQQQLLHLLAQPSFYQQNAGEIMKAKNRLQRLEQEIGEAYRRWEYLDEVHASTELD
ncbi:MAG: ATP-binding cassette domain-containing protein [Candidatus Omnitrophota bacterium]|jgi:ATP-binding cassette subfamily F protein uup|nr:MAG: ATP-binding cassette domain-containing protein [Candidatus Omnitrophota bacterium]